MAQPVYCAGLAATDPHLLREVHRNTRTAIGTIIKSPTYASPFVATGGWPTLDQPPLPALHSISDFIALRRMEAVPDAEIQYLAGQHLNLLKEQEREVDKRRDQAKRHDSTMELILEQNDKIIQILLTSCDPGLQSIIKSHGNIYDRSPSAIMIQIIQETNIVQGIRNGCSQLLIRLLQEQQPDNTSLREFFNKKQLLFESYKRLYSVENSLFTELQCDGHLISLEQILVQSLFSPTLVQRDAAYGVLLDLLHKRLDTTTIVTFPQSFAEAFVLIDLVERTQRHMLCIPVPITAPHPTTISTDTIIAAAIINRTTPACHTVRDYHLTHNTFDATICKRINCKYNHDKQVVLAASKSFRQLMHSNNLVNPVSNLPAEPYSTLPCYPAFDMMMKLDSDPTIPYYVSTNCNAVFATQLMTRYPPTSILLDNGANVHTVNPHGLVPNSLRSIPVPMTILTVGGSIVITEIGIMHSTQLLAYYTPLAPFSIISEQLIKGDPLWHLEQSNETSTLTNRVDHHQLQFHIVNGINISMATISIPSNYTKPIAHFNFTVADRQGIDRVYALLESGFSYSEIQKFVRHNTFPDLNISHRDVSNAKLAIGYSTSYYGGHAIMNQSPPHIRQPPLYNLRDTQLSCDVMQVYGHSYLLGVISGGLVMIRHLADGLPSTLNKALKDLLSYITGKRYTIVGYSIDAGSSYLDRLRNYLIDLLHMHPQPIHSGDHCPQAEVMIKILKERFRSLAIRIGTPLSNTHYGFPSVLVTPAIQYVVAHYNSVPIGDKTISPREELHGHKITYADMSLPFGTLVSCMDIRRTERNNTNLARTFTCLSLAPLCDGRGSYQFYVLATGKIITRAKDKYKIPKTVDANIYNTYTKFMKTGINIRIPLEDLDPSIYEIRDTVPVPALRPYIADDDDHIDPTDYDDFPLETTATQSAVHPPLPAINPHATYPRTAPTPLPNRIEHPPLRTRTNGVITNISNANPSPSDNTSTAEINSQMLIPEVHQKTYLQPVTKITLSNSIEHPSAISSPPPQDSIVSTPNNAETPTLRRSDRIRAQSKVALVTICDPGHLATSFANPSMITFVPTTKRDAIKLELYQCAVTNNTFRPRSYNDIQSSKHKIIGSAMLTNTKYDPLDGTIIKEKARLVAYGNQMKYLPGDLFHETSAPTPNFQYLLTMLVYAQMKGFSFKTGDVSNAFLKAPVESDTAYIRLDPKYADVLCSIRPDWSSYRNSKGVMYLELLKALYGLDSAGRRWYDLLSFTLRKIGFVQNAYDQCIFRLLTDVDEIIVIIYVDDFLFLGSSDTVMDTIITTLETQFGDLKINSNPRLTYLNMVIDTSNAAYVELSMTQYKKDLLSNLTLADGVSIPGSTDFATDPESPFLDTEEREFFHTYVAKCLYLSTHIHGEIAFYVSIISQRVHRPTKLDLKKLYHLLAYIKGVSNYTLKLNGSNFYSPTLFVDASYGINDRCRSQSGAILFFGCGAIYRSSSKQTITARSSSEAELIALSDKCSVLVGVVNFLSDFHIHLTSVTVYQDNKSTIMMLRNGVPTGKHVKHIHNRYFWLHDYMDQKLFSIQYIPTTNMVADILTKPTSGPIFKRFRDVLLGITTLSDIGISTIATLT